MADVDSFLKVLHHYGEVVHDNGVTYRGCCPIHGGDNNTAFVINKDNGLYYCHTGCQEGGDVIQFIMRYKKLKYIDAVQEYEGIIGEKLERETRKKQIVKQDVYKFDKQVQEYEITDEMIELGSYRDFEQHTINEFKLAINNYSSRVSIPLIMNGVLLGVTERAVDDEQPKWRHQPKGLKTSEMLYNYDSIDYGDEVVIVEGIFDVLAFYEIGVKAVATFGAHLTDKQLFLLLQKASIATLS